MRNSNLSSLFSSLNKNNPIDYSAYTSIKSGSYKKLLKARFAAEEESKSGNVAKPSQSNKKGSAALQVSTEANKLATKAKSLKESAAKLNDTELWKEGDGQRDKIISGVKQFAADYNDVISQSSNVKSSDVSKSTNWMKSLTGVMSNTLGRAGITVASDGSLSVDEEKMKKADLSAVKSLFTGSHSYADEISNDASSVASAATRSTSLYQANATLLNPVSNFFDQGF